MAVVGLLAAVVVYNQEKQKERKSSTSRKMYRSHWRKADVHRTGVNACKDG